MFKPDKTITFLFCIFLSVIMQAQDGAFGRTYQDKLPDDFKLDVVELRTHIHDEIPEEKVVENFDRQRLRFSDINAISIAGMMESGTIYADWPAMDKYLNEILERLIPEDLKNKKMIKAYAVKNGNFNAFMTATGHMFIHVGVFDQVEDEATLAGIIAHEIGHYYLKHGFEQFVKSENKEFNQRFLKRKVDYFKFSVNNELDCDSLALIWTERAGYNFKGAIKAMEILKKKEENLIKRYKNVWEIKKSTHPRGEKRVAKLQEYARKLASKKFPNYLVGEDKFHKLKKEAKTEILKHLLSSFQYDDCIEAAFRFHLQDLENTNYIYYLMEAIRRSALMNNNFWNKKFITHRYYDVVGTNQKKVKHGKHIFEEFNPEILLISKSKYATLPTKFYWEGETKFTTNEEAFDFFSRIGQLLKEPECLLSNALSVSYDKEKYAPLLKEYLKYENINFREYAKEMLNGTLRSKLPDNSIAILNGFDPVVRQDNEIVYVRDEGNVLNNAIIKEQLAPAFSNYSQFIYLPDLIDNQLNDYVILKEMAQYSQIEIRAKGQKIHPHVLDPRFWEVMNRFKANEFDFVELDLRDVDKNLKTIETYQNVLDFNLKSYAESLKRDRYIRVGVFSMRVKQTNIPKIIHLSNQENLKFKEPIFPQLTEFVKGEVDFKNEKAKEFDEKADKLKE